MNQIDRLQRTDHDFELDDLAIVVPFDEVDAVYMDTFDFHLELENGIAGSGHFPDISKALVEEDMKGRRQVLRCQLLAVLRRVDDRRVEDRIFGEQLIQARRVPGFDQAMPS